VVRAHPTVPQQKNPLWFQQRTDGPDVFARAKYKRRIQMALRMVALVRADDGSWFARKGIPEDVREPYARLFGVRREAHLRLPRDTPHHEAKTRCAEWISIWHLPTTAGMLMSARKQAPCNTQTQEMVETYYRNVQPGDNVVIRSTQGNILSYRIDTITDTNPKRGRIYIEEGHPWGGRAYYAKNGKSCISPTGQINLVVPTDEVITWIKANRARCSSTRSIAT
jgi:hypothetical protein